MLAFLSDPYSSGVANRGLAFRLIGVLGRSVFGLSGSTPVHVSLLKLVGCCPHEGQSAGAKLTFSTGRRTGSFIFFACRPGWIVFHRHDETRIAFHECPLGHVARPRFAVVFGRPRMV